MEKLSRRRSSSSRDNLSVLMLPWLAHGHVSPYLELAKKLTVRNFKIHLCSTPANLGSVRSKITGKLASSIKLVELHLKDTNIDLHPDFHTTNGLPSNLMNTLKEVFDTAGPTAFRRILKSVKPNLVVYDLLQPWAPAVAAEFGIPAVEFVTCSATMASWLYHWYTRPELSFPFSDTIYCRDYELGQHEDLLKGAEDARRVVQCIDRSSRIVLIKSFEEIEGRYADYFSEMSGKKVVPVGPLVQNPTVDNSSGYCDIMEWLNQKEKASTIFVSFGSEYFLSTKDMEEIARGLEMCEVNFIWVVRFPKDQKDVNLEEILPEGFFERVGNRGKVVNGWAPQARILVHPNTGGFVSHCGWNSVLEGLNFGLPIIAMPMHLDQPFNARLLEDVGAGVEVVRDSSGNLDGRKIAETIKLVVKEQGGESVRMKARDFQETIELKGEEEIDDLVGELTKICGVPKRAKASTKKGKYMWCWGGAQMAVYVK